MIPMLMVFALVSAKAPQVVVLTPGMVIDHSVTVKPGTYRLPSASLEAPAITVRGSDITLDLTGVTIEGGEPYADPDGYTGNGILINSAPNVTIKGGAIRGYKVGIRASKSAKFHLTGSDLSYNWKSRLWSGIEKESLLDWMSYHQNEKDEWLRYGAAIYLTDCDDCEVDNTRVVQGENGLMITRANRVKVWNNTFSWNSAIGLGMYRVSDSEIRHNHIDWDVRGFSHGYYFRGQDSSAILIYEQSHRNLFEHNSATHGGDGVFLWAGQTTMDTGQGGVNDNTFTGNDFSHAVANGIEATFSRNTFTDNRVDDCWHGVWGGYSYDSLFARNSFVNNIEGMAIEHGQNNKILDNRFVGGDVGIRLWANASQDPNWGYPKNRDTKSHGYEIRGNRFEGVKQELQTLRTDDVTLSAAPSSIQQPLSHPEDPKYMNAKLADGAKRGRATIIVDEWGPYDYLSPKLWPYSKPGDRVLKLRVIGPPGKWKMVSVRGATGQSTEGIVGQGIGAAEGEETRLTPTGAGSDIDVVLEYVGGEVVSPRGQKTPAGQPYRFSYRVLDPAANWTVRAWTFDEASDPIKAPAAFEAKLKTVPSKTLHPARLEYISGGTLIEGLPRDRVALVAEGAVNLRAGRYTLDVISDDGIKVWLDGKLVIDKWSVHESELDQVKLSGGTHRIKVQYFEQTGWAELQVRFRRD